MRIGRGWWPGPKVHRTAPVGQKAQRHHRCSARADRPLEDTTERHVRDVGRKRKDENLQRAGKAYEPSDMRLKPLKPPGDSQALYPPLDAQKVIRKVRRVMNNESNQEAEPPVFDATQPADTTWTMKDLFHGNLSKEVDDPSERTPRTGDDMQPSHGGGCTELLGRGSGRKRKANILQGFGKAEAHAEEPLPSENLSHKKHRAARSTASPERNHTAHGRMGFPSGVSEPTFPGTRTSHSLSSAAAAAKTRGGTALGSQQAMRPKQQAAEATGCTDPSVVDGNEDEDENAIKRNDPQASAISFGRQRKQAKSIVAGHTRVGLPPKLFVRLLTHKPRRRWFLAMLHGMQQRTAGLHD